MFIAEIGINHNGSLELAKELIDSAVDAGADVVKFQKRDVDSCVPKKVAATMRETPWGEMTYIEYKRKTEFGRYEYDEIDRYCKKKNILWTASVWDEKSLEFLMKYYVPFLKVPSACLTDLELLKKVVQKGVPVILSIGMSSMDEVEKAVQILGGTELTIMHCNSSYPAKEDELDLNVIPKLKERYPNYTIGYSGHELGIMPTLVAACLGAEVIERHITIDKGMWGTDQKASLDSKELRELIVMLRELPMWLGGDELNVYPDEELVRGKLRRCVSIGKCD